MPWGKHKGKAIRNVPAAYLAFVVEDSNASASLKAACRSELASRFGGRAASNTCHTHNSSRDAGISREKLKRWYRKASLLAHPDRGGSTALMKVINELMEL